jgi:uncharacterized protein (TIGR02145 family)
MKKNVNTLFTILLAFVLLYGCKKEPAGLTALEDIDGNRYGLTIIGNQVWMSENLRVTKYRDGSHISTGLSQMEWTSAGPAYAVYPFGDIDGLSSAEEVIEAYGLLYNWACITNSRGLCPDGYHIPSEAEFEELIAYLGGEDVAGGKLKSKRTAPTGHPRWDDPNVDATDGHNFHALPGGFRSFMGWYDYVGYLAEWWNTTELDANFAGVMNIYSDEGSANITYRDKNLGVSVRCIQD